jgi:hypothetical protein
MLVLNMGGRHISVLPPQPPVAPHLRHARRKISGLVAAAGPDPFAPKEGTDLAKTPRRYTVVVRFAWSGADRVITFDGRPVSPDRADLYLDLREVEGAGVLDLAAAWLQRSRALAADDRLGESTIVIESELESAMTTGWGTRPPLFLDLAPSGGMACTTTVSNRLELDEDIVRLFSSRYAVTRGGYLQELRYDDTERPPWWELTIAFDSVPDHWAIGQLYDYMFTLSVRVQLVGRDHADASTLVQALKQVGPSPLLDRSESQWLEVKSRYNRGSKQDRFELALDISSFANSDDGGLYVLGCEEVDERVTRFTPVGDGDAVAKSIVDGLNDRVIPQIVGLDVFLLPIEAGHIVCVHIPPQPASARPFVVHGASIGESVKTNYVSIAERRGARKYVRDARDIYLWIKAGQAFIANSASTSGFLPGSEVSNE